MLLHVLGIVCGLGVVAFAARVPARLRDAAFFGGILAAAAGLIGATRVPDPVWVGTFAALGAAVALWKPGWTWAATASAAMLAAVWIAVLGAQGMPRPAAYVLVLCFAAASSVLAARRPAFAPARLIEEAFVLVTVLAVMLAVAPAIADGWNSASALRALPLNPPAMESSAWVFAVVGGAAILGLIHSLWRRR